MIKEAIRKVADGKNLTIQESKDVILEIMSGKASDAQIGSILTALHIKGESIEEITGAALAMREKALKLNAYGNSGPSAGDIILDTCGTGGSGINTFNISTCSAFVISGCGVKVAKHGNKSMSGTCGSADVMQALGVKIDITPMRCQQAIKTIGIGFLYAPNFHKAMKYAITARKEIGIRTIFNILGPLTNPAQANAQVVGVFDGALTEVMAKVLKNLKVRSAFVVYGMDGLDEASIGSKTKVTQLRSSKVRTFYIEPEDFGLNKALLSSVKGGDAGFNADIILSVLNGRRGPKRDIVLMNAALALMCAGKADKLKEAVSLAAASIDSGRALDKLTALREFTK